jgi:phosphoesterase RecJ-like protein
MAATLRQTPEGRVKVSVRALPGLDAAAVCAKFGGGGHKGAAGATLDMTLEQAAAAVGLEMEAQMAVKQ